VKISVEEQLCGRVSWCEETLAVLTLTYGLLESGSPPSNFHELQLFSTRIPRTYCTGRQVRFAKHLKGQIPVPSTSPCQFVTSVVRIDSSRSKESVSFKFNFNQVFRLYPKSYTYS